MWLWQKATKHHTLSLRDVWLVVFEPSWCWTILLTKVQTDLRECQVGQTVSLLKAWLDPANHFVRLSEESIASDELCSWRLLIFFARVLFVHGKCGTSGHIEYLRTLHACINLSSICFLIHSGTCPYLFIVLIALEHKLAAHNLNEAPGFFKYLRACL